MIFHTTFGNKSWLLFILHLVQYVMFSIEFDLLEKKIENNQIRHCNKLNMKPLCRLICGGNLNINQHKRAMAAAPV